MATRARGSCLPASGTSTARPAAPWRARSQVRSVWSNDAELIARWILKYAGRPLAGLRTRNGRRSRGQHLVDKRSGMLDEEVEVKSSLGRLRFQHGLESHERRSIRALVSSLDRHVRSRTCAGTSCVTEKAFPERSQLRCVRTIDCYSYLLRRRQPSRPVVAGAANRGGSRSAGSVLWTITLPPAAQSYRGRRIHFALPAAIATDRRFRGGCRRSEPSGTRRSPAG